MAAGRLDRRYLHSILGSAVGAALALGGFLLLRAAVVGPAEPLALLALPAALVLAMVLAVALTRFLAGAFDPLSDPEPRALRLGQRVLSNTVEQSLVFCPAYVAAWASGVPGSDLTAAALLFAAGRLLFWAGYLADPLFRAPGMVATLSVTAGLGLAVLL